MTTDKSTCTEADLLADLGRFHPGAVDLHHEIKAIGRADWVTVASSGRKFRVPVLCEQAAAALHLSEVGFRHLAGDGLPGFSIPGGAGPAGAIYNPVGSDPRAIPLVFLREWEGAPESRPEVLEVSEDFRLFWNLYEDRTTGTFVIDDDIGMQVPVIRITTAEVDIRGSYLRRYLAARQLCLVSQVVVDDEAPVDGSWSDRDEKLVMPDLRVEVWSASHTSIVRYQAIQVLRPQPRECSGVWPFEPDDRHCEFIVGIDELGREVERGCCVEHGGPVEFLTPVWFRRSVLDRYYSDTDRYSVEESGIHGPTFVVPTDSAHDDVVMVWLGDLGRIPFKEQQHWRAHNIAHDGKISESARQRDLFANLIESDHPDHRFRLAYGRLNDAWLSRYGWPLHLPPAIGDEHVLAGVHVPSNASLDAFEAEIIPLAKSTVDFLNEVQLAAPLGQKVTGGINKLERFLDQEGLPLTLPPVLRIVQGARTATAAHRKSTEFDMAKLLDGAPDLARRFAVLLDALADGFDELTKAL